LDAVRVGSELSTDPDDDLDCLEDCFDGVVGSFGVGFCLRAVCSREFALAVANTRGSDPELSDFWFSFKYFFFFGKQNRPHTIAPGKKWEVGSRRYSFDQSVIALLGYMYWKHIIVLEDAHMWNCVYSRGIYIY
jgi:hypothetical protein